MQITVQIPVGFECCNTTPPTACCLYPGPGNGDDVPYLYDDADLPDNIVINGTVVPRTPGTYDYSAGSSIGVHGTAIDGSAAWQLFGTASLFFNCLIGDTGLTDNDGNPVTIADQFSDSYTADLSGFGLGSLTVNRVSLCEWDGMDDEGNSWSLIYVNPLPISKPMFYLQQKTGGILLFSKDDPQNKPGDSYDGGVVIIS